jgi:hypothetical protein
LLCIHVLLLLSIDDVCPPSGNDHNDPLLPIIMGEKRIYKKARFFVLWVHPELYGALMYCQMMISIVMK